MPDSTISNSPLPGLYIVATPIGNLGDITARAGAMLARADLIAAEDTRVTAKLLSHLGLRVPMTPYHDHSDERTRAALVARMADEVVVLVSDAGTPLISSPTVGCSASKIKKLDSKMGSTIPNNTGLGPISRKRSMPWAWSVVMPSAKRTASRT